MTFAVEDHNYMPLFKKKSMKFLVWFTHAYIHSLLLLKTEPLNLLLYNLTIKALCGL